MLHVVVEWRTDMLRKNAENIMGSIKNECLHYSPTTYPMQSILPTNKTKTDSKVLGPCLTESRLGETYHSGKCIASLNKKCSMMKSHVHQRTATIERCNI